MSQAFGFIALMWITWQWAARKVKDWKKRRQQKRGRP